MVDEELIRDVDDEQVDEGEGEDLFGDSMEACVCANERLPREPRA